MINLKDKGEINISLIWQMAIGSSVSWEFARLLGSNHPYLAPLTVVLCVQNTIYQSILFSFHRIFGTVIAILLIAYIANSLEMNGWVLGLLILSGTLLVKWLKLDITVLHQAALTIVLLFSFEQKSKDYAMDRIVDTILGAGIALFIQMFFMPPNFTKKASSSIHQVSKQLSSIFLDLSTGIQLEWGKRKMDVINPQLHFFLKDLNEAKRSLDMAFESLKFNPFGKSHKSILSKCQREIKQINKGYQYILNITETLKEWEKQETLSFNNLAEAGDQLKAFSVYFENLEVQRLNEKGKEPAQQLLRKLPHFNKISKFQPDDRIYWDSFNLETKKLLKSLNSNDCEKE